MKSHEVVVITGASAGAGRATVREFAKHSAAVALIARGKEGLEAARKEVEDAGGQALIFPIDVSDHKQMYEVADEVERRLGPIDIWVNCAMVTVLAPTKDMTPEEYRRVTEVTYLGVVNGTLAALRHMLPRDRGKIVQVGSAMAYRSIPLQSAYCGAKHAILGFTTSLRTELLHDRSNVHVTMVQMPALNTPQFSWVKNKMPRKPQPVPPIYQPEVAARAIYWAAHHRKREIYVGRSSVQAIVGNKIAPNFADHILAKKGYEAQQHDGHDDPTRPDNLWAPVEGDHGAHGEFDSRAESHSFEAFAVRHKIGIALASLSLGLGVFTARNSGKKRRPTLVRSKNIAESWWDRMAA